MALQHLIRPPAVGDGAEVRVRGLVEREHSRDRRGGERRAGHLRPAIICAVVAVILLYFVSRLYMLLALPIFFDEAHYTLSALLIGNDPAHTSPFIEVAYWGVPPLFTWIAAPMTRIMGDPLLAGRTASALIGALGLIGVWKAGRAVGALPVAMMSVIIYLLSPFALLYNRMAMVDGLLAVIGAFALLAAMRLAYEPSMRASLALGLCFAAAIFTKIFGPLDLSLAGAAIVAAPAPARRQVARLAALSVLIGLVASFGLLISPGGQSLILVAAQQQGAPATFMTRITGQLAVIGQTYWLYITPPVLALAFAGIFYCRRDPRTRVLLVWAVLSWVPFVVVHLSSRYLLTGGIPLMLLAALGTVELARISRDRQRPRTATIRRATAFALVVLGFAACVWEDVPMVVSPAQAALTAGDRRQYVTEWPAGYALERALADLRRRARGQTVTLISPVQNPPADDLVVLVGRDPHIHLQFRDLAELQHPGVMRRYPERTFVVVCRPVGQQFDARRAGLHLVVAEPNLGGVGGVFLYAAERPAAAGYPGRGRTL